MRCMNCGWDNLPNAVACLKCGQPLMNNIPEEADRGAVANQRGREDEVVPKPTILNANVQEMRCRETVVFGREPERQTESIQQTTDCPNCGYPVADKFVNCPNCGNPRHRLTIRRQVKNVLIEEKKPLFSLTIIPEKEEKISAERLEYEGGRVILNRQNTEVTNSTITSKAQAEITYEDGHWFISDKSEMGTTYIQVSRKMEIHPDDIIVMGDRRFKFESESL